MSTRVAHRGRNSVGRDGHSEDRSVNAPDHPDVRIILVGRTGLETALRKDPRAEVVRVRSTLQSIGELSDPAGASSQRPSIVVVGPDADPGPETDRYLMAVRLVDPHARVVLAADTAEQKPDARGFDLVVDPATPPERLRELVGLTAVPASAAVVAGVSPDGQSLRNAAPGSVTGSATLAALLAHASTSPDGHAAAVASSSPAASPRPATTPAPSAAPADVTEPKPGHAAPAPALPPEALTLEHGDRPLVEAALTGRDFLPLALDVLRARLGASDIHYTASAPGPRPLIAAGQAEVRHRDQHFGVLRSSTVPPSSLTRAAEWLAGWLALAAQQNELRRAALVDDLTGAWNRRYFEQYLARAIARAGKERQTLSVLLFDIDNFKYFNDRYGHAAGDEILKETVRLLQSVIRTSDRVCRIGGDEFAVIFYEPLGPRDPNSKPPESVRTLAERFQKQVAEARFPKLGMDAPGSLSVSGGLATYPWDGRSPQELLDHADDYAMQSKRSGKDKIILGPHAGPHKHN